MLDAALYIIQLTEAYRLLITAPTSLPSNASNL